MWQRLSFFALLYFVQGAALAYVVNFQKPYLASVGVSKETLGLFTSLLLIPFIAKVGLGALSDRVPWGRLGSRKPYMILGLSLFALGYALLARTNPATDFPTFAVVTWMASLGLALFDTCADGWAVDVSTTQEHGAVQAAMVAGKSLGLVVFSLGIGVLAETRGYATVFQILAAMAIMIMLIVLVVKPPQRTQVATNVLVDRWRDLLKTFYVAFAVFGIVYSIASFGTDGLLTLHLSEKEGHGVGAIGRFGVARGLGALIGAGVFALAMKRFGLIRSICLSLVFLGAGCLLPLTPVGGQLGGGWLWGLCWGVQETAYVTMAMRFAQGPWAASFFALAMIFSNVGTALGEALGAPLVPRFGYDLVFLGFALVGWAALGLVPLFTKPLRRRS